MACEYSLHLPVRKISKTV